MSKFKMPKFNMPKFVTPKLSNTKVTMSKYASRLNSQPPVIKVAIIAVLVVLALWFVNYLLDGNLLIIIGWLLVLSVFVLLLAVINPEDTVKLVKQLKAEWVTYQSLLKRSIKELREIFNRTPELVVVEEAEAPVSSAAVPSVEPSSSAASRVTPPATVPSTSTAAVTPPVAEATTPESGVPAAPPVPVKSATPPVNSGTDGIAAVAAATARVRRRPGAGGRKLAMPGDKEGK